MQFSPQEVPKTFSRDIPAKKELGWSQEVVTALPPSPPTSWMERARILGCGVLFGARIATSLEFLNARAKHGRLLCWLHSTRHGGGDLHQHHGGFSTLEYPSVWGKGLLNGYSSTRVSLWDSLMFGRLAMGFANARASRCGIR